MVIGRLHLVQGPVYHTLLPSITADFHKGWACWFLCQLVILLSYCTTYIMYFSLEYLSETVQFVPKGKLYFLLGWISELGTRWFCRDNVTMLSGHKVVCNCHFTIFIVVTPSRHWGLTIFGFFFWSLTGPWGYIMLPRCRFHEAKKLSRAQLFALGVNSGTLSNIN